MNIIKKIYYFFAPYASTNEKAVALFFKNITEHTDQAKVRHKLHELLQRDIAAINLWSEFTYKGYNYLQKSYRKKLYENLIAIEKDFDEFKQEIEKKSVFGSNDNFGTTDERLRLLKIMTKYFSPGRGVYEYRASSSFGRLLKNPKKEKLIGDCNQIVTLYIHIYSKYYDVSDLKIRILPEHVALHYNGRDIETTNGTFQNYGHKVGSRIMPIEEIVSVNLLDVSDEYLKTHEVDPKDFLQSTRFAFLLSHNRTVVKNNLQAAYGKLINELMANNNYKEALKFVKESKDAVLLSVVSNNGAMYYMGINDFSTAKKFASYSLKKAELLKTIHHNEGVHYFNAKKFQSALNAFEKNGDQTLIKRCYEALYFAEQEKLDNNLTTETIKGHATTIKRMHNYAKKSGNHKLITAADHYLKFL